MVHRDWYFDYRAKIWPYPLYVAASGNGGIDECVNNKFHNGLVVGGARPSQVVAEGETNDYNLTVRSNDVIWPSTSSKNPTSPNGDRELPMIVAAADSIGNLYAGGVTESTGTSGATPQVAATAAGGFWICLRAVLVWDSTATCGTSGYLSCTADTPDGDFDLSVIRADGATPPGVSDSWSFDNTYEFVESTVISGQTYKLRVYRRTPNAHSTWWAVAWTTF